tara:strand:+ start:9664 stop:10815 length:1152 start_codon:yes stop_codon:yes gene_type:complete
MIYLTNDTIDNKDIDSLIEWLKTYPRLTKGPLTKEFEEKWSKWLGTKYSVYCNSGSSANLLMLYALIRSKSLKNKKVVIPGLCWATDLAPALQLEFEPLLCDVSLDNLAVDVVELEKIFKEESPAVFLCVSILGFSPDLKSIKDLCDKYDVILLEDNCESLGTEFDGTKIGNFGLMSSYSMYFGHHISTIEGGMVCTDDKEIYDILLSIRSHGWDRDWDKEKQEEVRAQHDVSDFNSLYTFYHPGFNLRATDLQAYLGIGQLEKLDYICEKREKNFQKFQKGIKNDFWKPNPLDNTFTSSFCYPVIHPKRNEIIEALIENEIEVRPLVCGTMGKQPFYTENFGVKELKNCDVIDRHGLYVPNNPSLTDDEIQLIIDTINKIIK